MTVVSQNQVVRSNPILTTGQTLLRDLQFEFLNKLGTIMNSNDKENMPPNPYKVMSGVVGGSSVNAVGRTEGKSSADRKMESDLMA